MTKFLGNFGGGWQDRNKCDKNFLKKWIALGEALALGSLQFFSEHSLEKPSLWRETNDGNVKCHLAYEQALLWGIGQRESKKASLTMLTVFSGLL